MKRKQFLPLFILLFCFSSLFAQTVTVMDKVSLKPLGGVNIYDDKKNEAVTNPEGKADISSFTGSYSITFRSTDYALDTRSFEWLKTNGYVMYLTEKSYSTDEIIVSANKFQEKLSDIPTQVEFLNSQDMRFLNAQNTASLLEKTGNVFVQTSQLGGGSPVLRGFEASRVLIAVDGVRMNNAIFRAGHLQNVLRVDNANLDRTEILFGPNSLMYGSDALGGVMSFYTKDPVLSLNNNTLFSGDAFTRYSTANVEKTGHIGLNIASKKVGLYTSFTFSDFGDLRMGSNYGIWTNPAWKREFYTARINGIDTMLKNDDANVQKGTAYQQYNVLAKLLFKQSDNVKHTLNFQFSNTNEVPRYDRLNTLAGNGKFANAEWYYGPEKWLFGSYKLNVSRKESFFDDAQIIAAYQNFKESRNNRSFGKTTLTKRNENVDVFTFNADMNKKMKEHELRYGAEGTYNKVTSTAIGVNVNTNVESPASTRYPVDGSNMKSFSGYLAHSWEIDKMFTLSDGVRYNYVTLDADFKDTTFYKFPFSEAKQRNGAVTGHLGLTMMPGNDWRLYLNGATGFRAPNVDDLSKVFETVKGTATTLGTVIIPNPDLKPEYAYNAEFGISKVFMNSIKVEGIAYATLVQNTITSGPAKYNGSDTIWYDGAKALVQSNKNADKGSYILGYNVNISADVTNYFSIISTLNFTYGRIKTDSTDYPLDHVPPVFGQTRFQLKLNNFKGEFSLAYNGAKNKWDYNMLGEDNFPDATPFGMPGWLSMNVSAAYQINKNLQIQADLNNILDENYRTFASGINAPGRNLVLTLRGNLY